MTSLTETSYLMRKVINIGAIVVVILIIARVAIGVAIGLWRTFFPPPPPPATVAFGKLPYPSAQNNVATPSGTISYSLETPGQTLPTLPKTLKVYFMPHSGASFGSFDRMKTLASRIAFTSVPQKVSSTAWRFTDSITPLRILDIDEISDNFRLSYNYVSDLSLFSQRNFSSVEALTSDGRSFFDGLGLFTQDLKSTAATVTYFKLDSGTLVATTSLSNADAVGISFNRTDIDKMPVVSPDPKQGLVSILFSGTTDQKKHILEARYFYTPVDLENFATYPVTSADSAFNQLKSGRGLYAAIPTPTPTAVTIRKVFLAYLDPYPPQSYLQPVLVFSDEKGFVAYIPAVDPAWLQ